MVSVPERTAAEQAAARKRNDVLIAFEPEKHKDDPKPAGADVPVGAIIVKNGKIISSACNEREKTNDISSHAEILVIRRASELFPAPVNPQKRCTPSVRHTCWSRINEPVDTLIGLSSIKLKWSSLYP